MGRTPFRHDAVLASQEPLYSKLMIGARPELPAQGLPRSPRRLDVDVHHRQHVAQELGASHGGGAQQEQDPTASVQKVASDRRICHLV